MKFSYSQQKLTKRCELQICDMWRFSKLDILTVLAMVHRTFTNFLRCVFNLEILGEDDLCKIAYNFIMLRCTNMFLFQNFIFLINKFLLMLNVTIVIEYSLKKCSV